MSAFSNLTPEERDERVLMILRAAGQDGAILRDAYGEGFIRASLKTSLIPRGLARIEGKPESARAFITNKGLDFSTGSGRGA